MAHNRTGQFALQRSQNPEVVVQLPQLLLSVAVIPESLLVKLQHEMVVCTYFEASILFLLFDGLGVQLILHTVEDNRAVALILFLGLSYEIADFRLHKREAVVEPRLDKVGELEIFDIRVFDDVLPLDQVLASQRSHIKDSYHLEVVLVFELGQHLLNLLLVAAIINHSNCKSYFVDNFKLRPVVCEILLGEVKLLSAALPQDQHLRIGIMLLPRVAFVDGQLEVLITELLDFLLRLFGQGGQVFDEDGYSEVVIQTFTISCH